MIVQSPPPDKLRVFLRFADGRYKGCLLIQDGASLHYAWYWPGAVEWVDPPPDIQVLINLWTGTGYAGLELGEFLTPLLDGVDW